jgi:hypothetical protein
MGFEQTDIPLVDKDKNKIEAGYQNLRQGEEKFVRDLLGTSEQIYRNVKDALDALARGQSGSYRPGTSAFVNAIIGPRSFKISKKEFAICKKVIDACVVEIQEEETLRKEAEEELEKWRTERGVKQSSEEKMLAGAREWEESEIERTGVNPEDL